MTRCRLLLLVALVLFASPLAAATGTFAFAPPGGDAVAENAGSVIVTVNRNSGSVGAATVSYTTVSGSAVAGSDFTAKSGTLSFADGETSKTITIPILDDAIFEDRESFTVTLSNPTGGTTIGSPSTYNIWINDNDPGPTASINDIAVTEGNSGTTPATFTVTLSHAVDIPITIAWTTVNGTAYANFDFVGGGGSVTFAPGETTKTLTVQVIGDTQWEGDEYFVVGIDSPIIDTPKNAGRCTIKEDDAPAVISINDVQISEGDSGTKNATFTVTVTPPWNGGPYLNINYYTESGTATAGSDFLDRSGYLTFLTGESSKTITVPILGDTDPETDETFTVELTASCPYCGTPAPPLTKGIGVCTILNDDIGMSPQILRFAAGTTVSYFVQLGTAKTSPQTITLTATPNDVVALPASLTIPAGATSGHFDVQGLKIGSASITATFPPSLGGGTKSVAAEVLRGGGVVFDPAEISVAVGGTVNVKASIVPPVSDDVTISLASTSATAINIPASITIPAGKSTLIPVKGLAIGSASITATLPLTFANPTAMLVVFVTAKPAGPSLTNVTPTSGNIAGGTLVELTGTNFGGGCWPFFGGVPGKGATVRSTTSMVASTPPHAAGSVEVSVRCGSTSSSLATAFAYSTVDEPALVVTSVDPRSASPGESVTIAGVRFAVNDTVTFGTTPAAILSYAPDALVVRVPDLPLGAIAINVADGKGHMSTTGPIFTVTAPQLPQITSLTPSSVAAGGEVTVDGTGFRPGYVIAFGGMIAQYVSLDYTHVIVRVPKALTAGQQPTEVRDASNQVSSTGPNLTIVDGRVVITSLTPRCGTTDGGSSVTVSGNGFAAGATLTVDGVPASNVKVVDAQTITATAPAGAAGLLCVKVTNPNGDSASMSDAFRSSSPFDPDGACNGGSKRRAVRIP